MTPEEFKLLLKEMSPPPGLDPLLLALWYDAKGDWVKSHEIIQEMDNKEAARIHAYLHRKEGDLWNADFWYRKADTKQPNLSLEHELEHLIKKHLE